MPRNCRTCKSARKSGLPELRCIHGWACDADYVVCDEHEERQIPLLARNELADALYWLLNLHHGVSRGGNNPETGQPYPVTREEWKAALNEGMRAHARYTKEIVDA